MKLEQIYQELKDLAERLGVTVSEQNFRGSGIPIKSGFCLVKGNMHCIIDKNISLRKKTTVLAKSISPLPHEKLYVVPAIRELLKKHETAKRSAREIPNKNCYFT